MFLASDDDEDQIALYAKLIQQENEREEFNLDASETVDIFSKKFQQ